MKRGTGIFLYGITALSKCLLSSIVNAATQQAKWDALNAVFPGMEHKAKQWKRRQELEELKARDQTRT